MYSFSVCRLGLSSNNTTFLFSLFPHLPLFQSARETYPQMLNLILAPEIVHYMQQVCLAQAQECILEKSMLDNRKATIIGMKHFLLYMDLMRFKFNGPCNLKCNSKYLPDLNPTYAIVFVTFAVLSLRLTRPLFMYAVIGFCRFFIPDVLPILLTRIHTAKQSHNIYLRVNCLFMSVR